jgi:hypothetical protein
LAARFITEVESTIIKPVTSLNWKFKIRNKLGIFVWLLYLEENIRDRD